MGNICSMFKHLKEKKKCCFRINNLPAVIGVTPTLHRSLPNIELPHRPSLIAIFVIFAPNGGRPCEGSNAPFGIVFFFQLFKLFKHYYYYYELKKFCLI